MQKVAVLMSTYNGEKYLEEQIKSIFFQEGVKVALYVRDDGSSDSTKRMLNEYRKVYEDIHIFFGENVGVGNSFYNLLYKVPDQYDYYAFTDQDDIWDKDKLITAVQKLKESGCSLYACNQECVDAFGNYIGLRYEKDQEINLDPLSIMSKNMLAGCTMVFPVGFFKTLTEPSHRPSKELLKIRIHDVWTALAASVTDGIYYDVESHIKYRQHDTNVVGAYDKKGFLAELRKKIKKIQNKSIRNGRSTIAREIVEKYDLQESELYLLRACAYPKSIRNKTVIMKNIRILRSLTHESTVGFTLKLWTGLF